MKKTQFKESTFALLRWFFYAWRFYDLRKIQHFLMFRFWVPVKFSCFWHLESTTVLAFNPP
ncbi:MAG: hypothetical protein D6732_06950 [Methanobacteriota archaeon]|nr:MAG: hypothetical protein D6732_06950 [Euryarchaeota archaeon]